MRFYSRAFGAQLLRQERNEKTSQGTSLNTDLEQKRSNKVRGDRIVHFSPDEGAVLRKLENRISLCQSCHVAFCHLTFFYVCPFLFPVCIYRTTSVFPLYFILLIHKNSYNFSYNRNLLNISQDKEKNENIPVKVQLLRF
jgi:hypothetical protein